MNKREVGSQWEQKTVEYLQTLGITVLYKNFRCKTGEIDIIGIENDTYIFIEVKYRSSRRYGYSYEAVNSRKQQTIRKVAEWFIISNKLPSSTKCRFDVCGIDNDTITYIKNAF